MRVEPPTSRTLSSWEADQRLTHRLKRGFHEMTRQLIKQRARERLFQMHRPFLSGGDEGQTDRRLHGAGKLDLGLFRRFAHALKRGRVPAEVDAGVLFEVGNQVIGHALVEIVAAQMVVAGRGDDLHHVRIDVENGHVERAAAEVVHENLLLFVPVDAERQRRRRRLVDDAQNVQPRDCARVLRGLPLRVAEIGGHGDYRVRDGAAEIAFRVGFQL